MASNTPIRPALPPASPNEEVVAETSEGTSVDDSHDCAGRQGKVRRTENQIEEKDECRLCLQEVLEGAAADDGGLLVRPCSCRSAVHVDCLAQWRAAQMHRMDRSMEENSGRAATCEICGALWSVDGQRELLPTRTAICRAHGGFGKVALRRVPTAARDHGVFSEFSAKEGQELEVLELDSSGDFFRVRALGAERYHGSSSVAVAEGWLRRCYLEWPGVSPDPATAATTTRTAATRWITVLEGAQTDESGTAVETESLEEDFSEGTSEEDFRQTGDQ